MVPLADTHVHLLAAFDDGPRSDDEALAMCRMLAAEGVRIATALAHQNDVYPRNTPEAIRAGAVRLQEQLQHAEIPLTVVPGAEVILSADLPDRLQAGQLLTLGDRGKYLLCEMPYGGFINPVPIIKALQPFGIRLVLAHAERYEEFLHDPQLAEEAVAAGCLLQVTAEALDDPPTANDEAAMRTWAQRGMIHVLGSDGHRIDRRLPRLRPGYDKLTRWIGSEASERIAGIWGTAVLQGLPVNPPPPKPLARSWFSKLFG